MSKTYRVPVRQPGLANAFRSIFRRETRDVEAVREISFSVAAGEVVGFLGPNGAGKTTTLKMLSGLLNPDAGKASVLGHEPYRRERDFLRQITLVMGNRNQLIWDIPVSDSFERNRAIYRLPSASFRETVAGLTDLLDLGELLDKPVRNLSLGERMKCEIAAALLHRPKILFLDEPTIGLDVTMQRRIRAFIAEYNRIFNATVLLTSHYMADVEALCQRVVVITTGSCCSTATSPTSWRVSLPTRRLSSSWEREGIDVPGSGGWSPAKGCGTPCWCPRRRRRASPASCWPNCRWPTSRSRIADRGSDRTGVRAGGAMTALGRIYGVLVKTDLAVMSSTGRRC